MSKDTISSNYMNFHKGLTTLKSKPSVRYVQMIGADHNTKNIGSAIADYLAEKGMTVILENDHASVAEPNPIATDLVVCTGFTHLDWFEDVDSFDLEETFTSNVIGPFLYAQKFVRQHISDEFKHNIIFIGSMAYNKVLNGSSAYCASKAALAHLTRCLAWELAPKGFNVFCVHPSNTEDSPMSEKTIEGLMRYRHLTREEAEQYWSAGNPRNEFLTKDEIAHVVHTLLLPQSAYLSGSNIELAGGQR